jgi:hypothetical protein
MVLYGMREKKMRSGRGWGIIYCETDAVQPHQETIEKRQSRVEQRGSKRRLETCGLCWSTRRWTTGREGRNLGGREGEMAWPYVSYPCLTERIHELANGRLAARCMLTICRYVGFFLAN